MIISASSALPKLIILFGSKEPVLPLVLANPAIRYPVFSLLLIMELYKFIALLLDPIMRVLKKTAPLFNCDFALFKNSNLIQKVIMVCIPQREINSL